MMTDREWRERVARAGAVLASAVERIAAEREDTLENELPAAA